MRPVAILFALLLAGCAAPIQSASTSSAPALATTTPTAPPHCPDPHWHATFAVYLPAANGTPTPVDLATPRAAGGHAYYDLSSSDAGMGLAVHMHQSGPETGSAALGPHQWHFEQDGRCVGVAQALHAVEIDANATALRLFGGHAQAHQDGTWTANATARLRWFVQDRDGAAWVWQERTWAQVKGLQLPNGASLLVTLGDYSDAQVKAMQASIPAPIGRPTTA